MNRKEHLLIKLSEECNELGKAVSKSLLFGLDDGYPESDRTNAQDIKDELNDLFAVAEMLCSEGLDLKLDNEKIKAKKVKVERWMKYAQERKILDS